MTSRASRVRVTGPLAGYAEQFTAVLIAQRYTPLSAANQVRLMAHASRWLAGRGLAAAEFSAELTEEFLRERRAEGYTHLRTRRGMQPLMRFLTDRGVVPVAPPVARSTSPTEVLLEEYRCYLVEERALAASTIMHRLSVARTFLDARCQLEDGGVSWEELSAAEVTGFVTAQCRTRSVGWAKNLVTDLRSWLRFLHVRGHVAAPLWAAVPPVAGWRGSALPRAIPAAEVNRLLASCDRRRGIGRRDYAILMLLARLGLRACEVAALELGDLDWRAGVIVIRGKSRRVEQLPLPYEVGEAIASYLHRGRPGTEETHVFMRVRAPHGPLNPKGVSAVVGAACDRAGLPRIGPHRLRHSLATDMLRAGAPLAEVGQVLRHRSAATTTIYAKVDRNALRPLAQPWPGSAS